MSLYGVSSLGGTFFVGDGEPSMDEMEPSEFPTSVWQAIISLSREMQIEVAREVFGSKNPERYVNSESFFADVLAKIEETDLCDGFESPITVYIDPDQWYSVTVYEEDE